jgi:hypothetical protein
MAAVVVARDQSLICLVDDEQWLDQASEQTLGFVARRLAADAAVRPPPHAAITVATMNGGLNDTATRIYCTSLRQGF